MIEVLVFSYLILDETEAVFGLFWPWTQRHVYLWLWRVFSAVTETKLIFVRTSTEIWTTARKNLHLQKIPICRSSLENMDIWKEVMYESWTITVNAYGIILVCHTEIPFCTIFILQIKQLTKTNLVIPILIGALRHILIVNYLTHSNTARNFVVNPFMVRTSYFFWRQNWHVDKIVNNLAFNLDG